METEVVKTTIDCTPTWESLVTFFTKHLEDDRTPEDAKQIIRDQIRKMAQVADAYVDHLKKQEATLKVLEKLPDLAEEVKKEFKE